MDAVTYKTLEYVAMSARPYPTHLLTGCETGLVLFAAAFLGHNDAIHFAEAGLEGTCCDIDAERLEEMKRLYPDNWTFVAGDAWELAQEAADADLQWDVVSVDTFTGEATDRSLSSLDLWCRLARRVVTATITDEVSVIDVPGGWTLSLYPRSDTVSWLVLSR